MRYRDSQGPLEMKKVGHAYVGEGADFLRAIGDNMPQLTRGMAAEWQKRPDALKKVLAALDVPLVRESCVVNVWRDVVIGGESKDKLIERIKPYFTAMEGPETGMYSAEAIIRNEAFVWPIERQRLSLAKVSLREIGFIKEPHLVSVLNRLKEFGCWWHPAVGPALRFEYSDQPRDDYLALAMDPIPDHMGIPNIFNIDGGDGGENPACLDVWWSGDSWDDHIERKSWSLNCEFVAVIGEPQPA